MTLGDKTQRARDAPTKSKDDFFPSGYPISNIEGTNKNSKKIKKKKEEEKEMKEAYEHHARVNVFTRERVRNKRLDTRGRTQDVAFNAHVSKKHYTMDTL